jgi:general secretion pathway protein K
MISPRHRSSQAGIALVAVLWGLLLLSMLAAAFGTEARTEARLARNFLENAEARAAADAGVFWAVAELAEQPDMQRIVPDGTPYELVFTGVQLQISVQDEAGKVDLNAAPTDLIVAAMTAAGDPGGARDIAERIDEWRKSARLRKAEERRLRRDDRDAQMFQGGGVFRVIEELRAVPGITPGLYEAAEPFLTVHSGQSSIDPSVAPLALLRALDSDASALHRKSRDMRPEQTDRSLPAAARQTTKPSAAAVYTIEARAMTAAGARFTRRAIVQLSTQAQSPYRFLRWMEF